MDLTTILIVFIILRLTQQFIERRLSRFNRQYYENEKNRNEASRILDIKPVDMDKALVYSRDKYKYSLIESWVTLIILFLVGDKHAGA